MTWGSTGPLTNQGFHDFFGIAFVYLFPAGMALVLVRRVGARPGMYEPHPKVPVYRSYNLGLTTVGVALIFSGLPMVILSCLFFFAPEQYAVSVTMAETSVGVAFNNLGLAWAGGALDGAAIAYWKKSYIYLLLGPLGAYVAGAPAFDIYKPWQMFLVALGAPFVCYVVYEFSQRRGWDEHKLTPLFLGAGTYGLLMVGLIKWGEPQGGYFGLTEGEFAFQNAEVNVFWQALGHRRRGRPRRRDGRRDGVHPRAHDRPAALRGGAGRGHRRAGVGSRPGPHDVHGRKRRAGGTGTHIRRARERAGEPEGVVPKLTPRRASVARRGVLR